MKISEKRMDICKKCDRLDRFKRCKECGCFMVIKTKIKTAKCPLKKW